MSAAIAEIFNVERRRSGMSSLFDSAEVSAMLPWPNSSRLATAILAAKARVPKPVQNAAANGQIRELIPFFSKSTNSKRSLDQVSVPAS